MHIEQLPSLLTIVFVNLREEHLRFTDQISVHAVLGLPARLTTRQTARYIASKAYTQEWTFLFRLAVVDRLHR